MRTRFVLQLQIDQSESCIMTIRLYKVIKHLITRFVQYRPIRKKYLYMQCSDWLYFHYNIVQSDFFLYIYILCSDWLYFRVLPVVQKSYSNCFVGKAWIAFYNLKNGGKSLFKAYSLMIFLYRVKFIMPDW